MNTIKNIKLLQFIVKNINEILTFIIVSINKIQAHK